MYSSLDQTALNITHSILSSALSGTELEWEERSGRSSGGTVIFVIHDLGASQPYRQFGLMTHQRICLGPCKSQRTRVRDEGDIQGCGLFSWTGVNQRAWRSRASWRAMIQLAFMSRMSHSQSREEAMLACWRKPLVLIINDVGLCGVGPEQAYCGIAWSCMYITWRNLWKSFKLKRNRP